MASTSSLPPSDPGILAHVQEYWQSRLAKSPIYQFLLQDVQLTYASKGIFRARLTLTPTHTNGHGGIHGSVSATIVDWAGGLAIASYDGRCKTGVSTDIHISYQSTAKAGESIEIEGRAGKIGGTLGFTSVTIWKVVDGEPGPVVAMGSHTKFLKV